MPGSLRGAVDSCGIGRIGAKQIEGDMSDEENLVSKGLEVRVGTWNRELLLGCGAPVGERNLGIQQWVSSEKAGSEQTWTCLLETFQKESQRMLAGPSMAKKLQGSKHFRHVTETDWDDSLKGMSKALETPRVVLLVGHLKETGDSEQRLAGTL